MATTASASLLIRGLASLIPEAPVTEPHQANQSTETRWTQGIASGQIDRIYFKIGSLIASATDLHNLLAAGALKDTDGQAIDADELKGIIVECLTGAIIFEAPAANFLPCFDAGSHGFKLAAGQRIAVDFGAAGLTLGASASFNVRETSTTLPATYMLWLVCAQ